MPTKDSAMMVFKPAPAMVGDSGMFEGVLLVRLGS